MCVFLRRLVSRDRLSALLREFGRSQSGICNIYLWVLDFLDNKFGWILDRDWRRIAASAPAFAEAVHRAGAPLANVWGFIDGTARTIARPTEGQEAVYSGHKRIHCLKFQSIVTPDGLIAHLHGPIEGRRHDMALLNISGVLVEARRYLQGYALYGDSGYQNCGLLVSPFRNTNTLTAEERRFNVDMSIVRVSVEHAFGVVQSLFPYLCNIECNRIGLSPVGKVYRVAVLMSNAVTIVRGENVITARYRLQPPTLDEYFRVEPS